MSYFIIDEAATVNFLGAFPPAIVTVKPGTISSSAATTKITNKGPCLEGDESSVAVMLCEYKAPPFIGGMGTLKIDKLNGDQLTKTTTVEGKKVILKGSQFDAVFEVTKPAQDPQSKPDLTTKYSGGKGSFVASNTVIFAS